MREKYKVIICKWRLLLYKKNTHILQHNIYPREELISSFNYFENNNEDSYFAFKAQIEIKRKSQKWYFIL